MHLATIDFQAFLPILKSEKPHLLNPLRQNTAVFFFFWKLYPLAQSDKRTSGITNSENPRPIFLTVGWYILNPGGTITQTQAPKQENRPDGHGADSSSRADQQKDNLSENATELGDQVDNGEEEEMSAQGKQIQNRMSYGSDHKDSVIPDVPPPITNTSPGVLAKSTSGRRLRTNRNTYVAQGLLLDPAMAQLINSPYDPFWIGENDIDTSILTGFTSPMELEQIFAEGILQVGDIFRVVQSDGHIYTEEAEVGDFT